MRKCSEYTVNWKKYIMKPYIKYNLNFIIILFITLKCTYIYSFYTLYIWETKKIQQNVIYVIIFINHIVYLQ